MDQRGKRIATVIDELDERLICDTCGDLTLPTVADLHARGRRHALANPDHEVHLQWRAVKHFFVRDTSPTGAPIEREG